MASCLRIVKQTFATMTEEVTFCRTASVDTGRSVLVRGVHDHDDVLIDRPAEQMLTVMPGDLLTITVEPCSG